MVPGRTVVVCLLMMILTALVTYLATSRPGPVEDPKLTMRIEEIASGQTRLADELNNGLATVAELTRQLHLKSYEALSTAIHEASHEEDDKLDGVTSMVKGLEETVSEVGTRLLIIDKRASAVSDRLNTLHRHAEEADDKLRTLRLRK